MRHRSTLGIVFALIIGVTANGAAGADCLKYEPASVTLNGHVMVRQFFGAPGFGRTPSRDEKTHDAVLSLDAPICVDGTPGAAYNSKSEKNITAMQMVFANYPFGTQWHDKRVTVTGMLFHAFTWGHHTRVVLMVTDVHVAGEGQS